MHLSHIVFVNFFIHPLHLINLIQTLFEHTLHQACRQSTPNHTLKNLLFPLLTISHHKGQELSDISIFPLSY